MELTTDINGDEIYPDPEDFIDDDEPILDDVCPCCHQEYDEIDYDFQICHICGFHNDDKS